MTRAVRYAWWIVGGVLAIASIGLGAIGLLSTP